VQKDLVVSTGFAMGISNMLRKLFVKYQKNQIIYIFEAVPTTMIYEFFFFLNTMDINAPRTFQSKNQKNKIPKLKSTLNQDKILQNTINKILFYINNY
jgi:hypothetical protein